MRPSLTLFALFTLSSFHSLAANTQGICTVSRVIEKHRIALDRSTKKWIYERYNETVEREECCQGYRARSLKPLWCSPICDPACVNSECIAPDICVCHPDHVMINNDTSTCIEVCNACVNGLCVRPDDVECTCNHGYEQDPRLPHICNPICFPQCINATCSDPDHCECYDGYTQDSYEEHVCVPHCVEDCVFGTCTAPDECTCYDGYINDKDSPSICLPVCNKTCVNGDCYAPNQCKCHDGFTLHAMEDSYQCVPNVPEHSSLNYCVLLLPQAIKFVKGSDCFLIKENITISISADCRVLEGLSDSFCSRLENCHLNECVLNFWCSMKNVNGSNEIHCYLEQGVFPTDSPQVDHISTSTEWSNMVLVIKSHQQINSSLEIKQNGTKEWTLQPLNKGPICGKMHFTVQMTGCEVPKTGSLATNPVNSSFLFWLNISLACMFLLMVGVGIGGFLWARHRRLNNPLNYRGNTTQGYNNECFDSGPTELVSDDDSDHYSDGAL